MGVGDAEDDGREVTGAGTQQENNSDSSNSNNLLQTMQGEPNGGVLVSKSLGAGGSLGGREDGGKGKKKMLPQRGAAMTLPAGELNVEMLRRTRPQMPKPPAAGVGEAWGTPGKKTRNGLFGAGPPTPGKTLPSGTNVLLGATTTPKTLSAGKWEGRGSALGRTRTQQGSSVMLRSMDDTGGRAERADDDQDQDFNWTGDAASFSDAAGLKRAASLPKLPLTTEEKRARIPQGSIFERDSPRARNTLRSFLRNFMEENGTDIRTDIDLQKHSVVTGQPISNAWIQELCVMQNNLKRLNLGGGAEVTDVGLWAVARHCTGIEHLELARCDAITKVGLRSLALRCQHLKTLNFDQCTKIDDLALRTLAAGCWELQVLSLRGCHAVSDVGIAEMARCCRNLTKINVSECPKVGEFGDMALLEIGRFCNHLEALDMYGCTSVQDPGVVAIAEGCPKLATLRLTGCKGVSGKAVLSLAKHCSDLTDLSLAGCEKVQNRDLASLARRCFQLQKLDLSECHAVSASGVQHIVSHCHNLRRLNLERCDRLGDDSCLVLAHAHQLEYLNLGGCPAVSERGVQELSLGCTGLENLNITGCHQISRRFVMSLISRLEFCQPATDWYGYEPKPDSEALRIAKKVHERRVVKAVEVQRCMRGYLGRRAAYEAYRLWVMKHTLTHVQARVRGALVRRGWAAERLRRLQVRAASTIAATYRGCVDRRRVRVIHEAAARKLRDEVVSVQIQRLWRGHVDRAFVKVIRRDLYERAIEAAQFQALLEVKARLVQGIWRKRTSRRQCDLLRAARDAKWAREELEERCARLMQRILRGFFGRNVFKRVRAEYDQRLKEWRSSIYIEAGYRGMVGRRRAAYLRWLKQKEYEIRMATRIQNAWRANRARYLSAMARSMRELRAREYANARSIQKMWRARLGRFKAARRRILIQELKRRERAAVDMCRVFRGHKGREKWEVAFQLKRLEEMCAPLYAREKELLEEKAQLVSQAEKLKVTLEANRADTDALREEMETMLTVKHKFWDTSRINGTPQRFLTEYVKVRMAEQLAEGEARIEEDKDRYNELVVLARQRERALRQVRRELMPLTQGMAVKTKRDRTVRIRNRVRLEKWASTYIQRMYRGHRLRTAFFSWYRDYWTEVMDETTGDTYFYNTWSEEVKWVRPLEMTLLPHLAQPPPEAWEEAFDDEKGCPVWISATTGEKTYSRPPELDYA